MSPVREKRPVPAGVAEGTEVLVEIQSRMSSRSPSYRIERVSKVTPHGFIYVPSGRYVTAKDFPLYPHDRSSQYAYKLLRIATDADRKQIADEAAERQRKAQEASRKLATEYDAKLRAKAMEIFQINDPESEVLTRAVEAMKWAHSLP